MFQIFIFAVLLVQLTQGEWHEQSDVCFGTRDDTYGSFRLTTPGLFRAVKLEYINGSVTCTNSRDNTFWGCKKKPGFVSTFITTARNSVIFPRKSNVNDYYHRIPGVNANSTTIAYANVVDPVRSVADQEFRVWYGFDLNGNGYGYTKTCAKVFASVKAM